MTNEAILITAIAAAIVYVITELFKGYMQVLTLKSSLDNKNAIKENTVITQKTKEEVTVKLEESKQEAKEAKDEVAKVGQALNGRLDERQEAEKRAKEIEVDAAFAKGLLLGQHQAEAKLAELVAKHDEQIRINTSRIDGDGERITRHAERGLAWVKDLKEMLADSNMNNLKIIREEIERAHRAIQPNLNLADKAVIKEAIVEAEKEKHP